MENKTVNNGILASTIGEALDSHDTFTEKIRPFLFKIKYLSYPPIYEFASDNIIRFYDEDKNLLLKSRFEYMSIYYENTRTLKWAWSIPSLNKRFTSLSRKLLEYALDLDSSVESELLLKAELLNSRIKIENDLQLTIHTAIASYLAKQPFIYKLSGGKEINLKNVKPKDSYEDNFVMENDEKINIEKTDNSKMRFAEEEIDKYPEDKFICYLYILDHDF